MMNDPPVHLMWMASSYEPDQPKRDRKFNWHRFLGLLRGYRIRIVALMLCTLVNACLGVAPPILAKAIIDGPLSTHDARMLLLDVAYMVLVAIAGSLLFVLQGYLNASICEGIIRDVRTTLITQLMRMPISFFSSTRTGQLMNRVSNDIERLNEVIGNTAVLFLINGFGILSAVVGMFALDWHLSIVALSVLPLMVLPLGPVGHRMYVALKRTLERRDDVANVVQATLSLSGIILLKSFERRLFEQKRLRVASNELMKAKIEMATVGRLFVTMIGALVVIGPSLVWLAGGYLVFLGNISVGTIVAFVALISRLYGPASSIATTQTQIVGARAVLDRIFEYFDLELEPFGGTALAEVRGDLHFEKVTFQYSAERVALDDVSFQVRPGQVAALVGPSGAGKTTIAQLLTRFYEPKSGTISLDSVDIKTVSMDSLRSHIGFVTQETYLFHDSVEQNIRCGREHATQEEIETAARLANAYEFIMTLPRGFKTVVGERGHVLSGGERQRIAIARVLLKNPRILILDEATSALDSANEYLIQVALERAMRGRTTIMIAHRLSTVVNADVIFVINAGRIVEQGTHSELLAKRGLYAKLSENAQVRQEPIVQPHSDKA